MSKMYLNPPSDVFEGRVGRRLQDPSADVIPRPYAHYRDQLRPGELLYMGLRGGATPPQMVVWVYDEETYNTFYGRYFAGWFTAIDFYAIREASSER